MFLNSLYRLILPDKLNVFPNHDQTELLLFLTDRFLDRLLVYQLSLASLAASLDRTHQEFAHGNEEIE